MNHLAFGYAMLMLHHVILYHVTTHDIAEPLHAVYQKNKV